MNNTLYLVISIIIIIISIITLIISYHYNISPQIYNSSEDHILSILSAPTNAIKTPFYDKKSKQTFPFIAGIPININGIEHVFVGGNKNQPDQILKYSKKYKSMVNVINDTGIFKPEKTKYRNFKPATYGGVSVDLNNSGLSDLIVARDDGVIYFKQYKPGKFTPRKILEEQKDKIPIALTVSDYDKNGNLDIFISNFIGLGNSKHSKSNIISKNSGVSKTSENTSAFMTQDTGEVEIWKNENNKFDRKALKSGFGFWIGKTPIRKNQKLIYDHLLFNNNDFKFKRVRMNGLFGWGDINSNRQNDTVYGDILNPFNHIFPQISPVLYTEGSDPLKYKKVKTFPNYGFGDNILIVDADIIQDVVWVNMVGPVKIFSNRNPANNNYINVIVHDHRDFTNAKVSVVLSNGEIINKEKIFGGTGFGSDIIQFDVARNKTIKVVIIETIHHKKYIFQNPKINSNLYVNKK